MQSNRDRPTNNETANDSSRSGVRPAFTRRAPQGDEDILALVASVVASLHPAQQGDEHEWLRGLIGVLAVTGIACTVDVGGVRHGSLPRAEVLEAIIDEHMGRAMTERRAVQASATEGVDWLISAPMDDDEHALGAFTVYGLDGAREPSMSLVQTLADLVALGVSSWQREGTLRDALRRRDDAMAAVAHDLKNPIGVIVMMSRMSSGLETIERNAKYALSLVQDILESAVMSGEQLVVRRLPCDAGALVTEVLSMIEPRAATKDIHLNQRIASELGAIFIDPRRIMQVLFNLIGNAVKFTPRGGAITVAVEQQPNGTTFSVMDSGPGIAPEQIAHVFERFWRGEGSDSGTGLGLTIARGIVEAHGGSIWVQRDLGREHGANVMFNLP
jgi:signal transduction histidine kinase